MISKIVAIAALLVASSSVQHGGKWGGYPGIWDGHGQSIAAASKAASSDGAASTTAATSGTSGNSGGRYGLYGGGLYGSDLIGGYPGIWGGYRDSSAAASKAASSDGAASAAATTSGTSGVSGERYGLYGGELIGGYPGIWGGYRDSSASASRAASSDGAASAAAATSGTPGISGERYGLYGGGLYGSDLIGGYPGIWGVYRDSSAATAVAKCSASSGGATSAAEATAGSRSSGIYEGKYGLHGGALYRGDLIGGYPGIWGRYGDSSASTVAGSFASSGEAASTAAAVDTASGASGIYGGRYGLYGGELIGGYPEIWGGYGDFSTAAAAAASAASSGGSTSAAAATAASGESDTYGGKYGFYGDGLYGGSLIGSYPVIWGGYGDSSAATASFASLGGATSAVAASGTPSISGGRYGLYGGGLYGIDLIGGDPGIWGGYGGPSATAAAAASAASSGGATSAGVAAAASGSPGIYEGKYVLNGGRLYGGGLIGSYPGIWSIYGDSSASTVAGSVASSGEAASAAAVASGASGIYGGRYGLNGGELIGLGLP